MATLTSSCRLLPRRLLSAPTTRLRIKVESKLVPHRSNKDIPQRQEYLAALRWPTAGLVALRVWAFPSLALADVADDVFTVEPPGAVLAPPALDPPVADVDITALADVDVLVLAAGALAVISVVALAFFFRRGYAGDVAPDEALGAVQDGAAVLLDIRSTKDKSGSPRVKSPLKGQPGILSVPFDPQDPDSFLEQVEERNVMAFGGSIVVVDSSGSAELAVAAAKALTRAGMPNVQVLKGGAQAWKEAGLPWATPLLPPALTLSSPQLQKGLKSAVSTVSEAAGKTQEQLPGILGVLAAVGLTAAVVVEAEALFQLAASVAAGQLFVSKLLFAKDREETLKQLSALLSTTRSSIGKGTATETQAVPKGPALSSTVTTEEGAAAESAPAGAVGSLEQSGTDQNPTSPSTSTDLPQSSRPLSPYTAYPDLKPPSSPTPKPPL